TGGSGIEIRLDNKDGILLGTCSIKNTRSLQKWATLSCQLRKASGIHDVYFLFKGGTGNLFNFDWWKMNQ
ncbi:MAG: carbohydrate-binding protein, partial [Bacteroidota bacterium]|nr:carbohydrate-binding protein [Bacteroidota bacterium]